jgi:hypothetical protein
MNWWFWGPILGGAALWGFYFASAFINHRNRAVEPVAATRIEGGFYPVAFSGGVLGLVGPVITLMYAQGIAQNPPLVSLLRALAMLSLACLLMALIVTGSAGRYKKKGQYHFKRPFWLGMHGGVFGLLVAGVATAFLIAYFMVPSGTASTPTSNPAKKV